jgi:hypothetical protein
MTAALFIALDEWRQILAFASTTKTERAALLESLVEAGNEIEYQRAARSFNFLTSTCPRVDLAELVRRPGWMMSLAEVVLLRRLDLVARIQDTFGVVDPVAAVAQARTAGR